MPERANVRGIRMSMIWARTPFCHTMPQGVLIKEFLNLCGMTVAWGRAPVRYATNATDATMENQRIPEHVREWKGS